MYIYKYIHRYTCTFTSTYISTFAIHVGTQVHTQLHSLSHTQVYLCTYVSTYIHKYFHIILHSTYMIVLIYAINLLDSGETVLLFVFQFLSLPDLCRVQRVCRTWKKVSHHPLLWKRLVMIDMPISKQVSVL